MKLPMRPSNAAVEPPKQKSRKRNNAQPLEQKAPKSRRRSKSTSPSGYEHEGGSDTELRDKPNSSSNARARQHTSSISRPSRSQSIFAFDFDDPTFDEPGQVPFQDVTCVVWMQACFMRERFVYCDQKDTYSHAKGVMHACRVFLSCSVWQIRPLL